MTSNFAKQVAEIEAGRREPVVRVGDLKPRRDFSDVRDVVRGYLPDPNVVAQEVQSQLKDNLGITATIQVMESADFLDSSSKGELTGLYLLGCEAVLQHARDFFLDGLCHREAVGGGGLDDAQAEHVLAVLVLVLLGVRRLVL